ncbi:hypothetical protein [Hyphococcus sp.]|uniref:hypothetical protein n=1 Tax=Hyphococcus sp. TaxID=2038636 RepID=UPI002080B8E7|nr:MAG: hypothetical protein DHS20C04_17880 [Marinicaulis sp.]
MLARDNFLTLMAVSLLAYGSADIAHHAIGHGGACIALGGHIVSLSSTHVECTIRGAAIDLAGPFASLLIGATSLGVFWFLRSTGSSSVRLLYGLVAAFNLFWFFGQLLFSAATLADDWAWALHQFRVGNPVRFAMIITGVAGYGIVAVAVARGFADFALPNRSRLARIVTIAWLTAGVFACATALFDRAPMNAILHHAAPQSFGLAAGLLLAPRLTPNVKESAAAIRLSLRWLAIASLVAGLSVVLLGPGFAL